MTQATDAKTAAIRAALPHRPHLDIVLLLAMLTSQDKAERESAKKEVRSLTLQGNVLIDAQQNAAALAAFANRHEP